MFGASPNKHTHKIFYFIEVQRHNIVCPRPIAQGTLDPEHQSKSHLEKGTERGELAALTDENILHAARVARFDQLLRI